MRILMLICLVACGRSFSKLESLPAPVDSNTELGSITIKGRLADGADSALVSASADVLLTLTPSDPKVTTVLIANTDRLLDATPISATGPISVPWTLAAGDGTKTVYARFVTSDARVQTVSAAMTLDTTPPVWISLETEAMTVAGTGVTWTYAAQDNLDTNADLQVAIFADPAIDCRSAVYAPYGNASQRTGVTGMDGTLQFRACVRDRAMNASPLLASRNVIVDVTPPSPPLLNLPIATAGGALLTWQDSNIDSSQVVVEVANTPDFSGARRLTSDSIGTCSPRRSPVPSFFVPGLDNLQQWYFRVHFIDCAGNAGDAATQTTVVGIASLVGAGGSDDPWLVYSDGQLLWELQTSRADEGYDPGPPLGRINQTTYVTKIKYCDTSTTTCLANADWHGTSVRPAIGRAGSHDYECDDGGTRCTDVAPVLAPGATFGRIKDNYWVATSTRGNAALYSAPAAPTNALSGMFCPAPCTGNVWGGPITLRSDTLAAVNGTPVIASTRKFGYVFYTRTIGANTSLSFSRCPTTGACTAPAEWSAVDTSVRVTPANGARAMLGSIVVADRPFVGVLSPSGDPQVVRCTGACTTAAHVQAISLGGPQATAPPQFAVTPRGLYAAWPTATGIGLAFSDHASGGATWTSQGTLPAAVGDIAMSPSTIASDNLRIAASDGQSLKVYSCDTSAETCTWGSATLQALPDDARGVSMAFAAGQTMASLTTPLLGQVMFTEQTPALSAFHVLPSVGQNVVQWQARQQSTATVISYANQSLTTPNASVTQAALSATSEQTITGRAASLAGTSDALLVCSARPFSEPTSLAWNAAQTVDAQDAVYTVKADGNGVSLGRCTKALGCSLEANWTYAIIANDTNVTDVSLTVGARLAVLLGFGNATHATIACELSDDDCLHLWTERQTLPHTFSTPSGAQQASSEARATALQTTYGLLSAHSVRALYPYAYCYDGSVPQPAADLLGVSVCEGPTGCFAGTGAWSQSVLGLIAAGDDGFGHTIVTDSIHDARALEHPNYGYLVVTEATSGTLGLCGHASSVDTRHSHVDMWSCPFFNVGSSGPTRHACNQTNAWSRVEIAGFNDSSERFSAIDAFTSAAEPTALAYGGREYTVVSAYDNGMWRLRMCLDAADATYKTAWPCASGGWLQALSTQALSAPVGSRVRAIDGNLVATFVEEDRVLLAVCMLGNACEVSTNWHVTTVDNWTGSPAASDRSEATLFPVEDAIWIGAQGKVWSGGSTTYIGHSR